MDKEEAIKWYTLAAADGSAEAQARLGAILAGPGRSELEFKKAVTLLEFASDQGSDYGDYFRGFLQLYGSRYQKGNPMSARLIALSLQERKSVHGDRLLARIFDHGGAGGRDPKRAASLFRKATLAGDAESQAEMGIRYERSDGVERDLVEAFAWLSLAAPVRATGALRLLDQLRQQLSAEELHRSEQLAQERKIAPALSRELQLDEK